MCTNDVKKYLIEKNPKFRFRGEVLFQDSNLKQYTLKVDRVLNLNDQLLVLMLQIRVGSLESKKLIIPAFDLICAHYIEQPANSRAKSDKN